MTQTLLSTITSKAEASFNKVVDENNFFEWVEHWFKVAERWRDELAAEGLTSTVAAIDDHIFYQRSFCRKYLRGNLDESATKLINDAQAAGVAAKLRGWALSDNPYAAEELKKAWEEGYNSVKE